MRRIACIILFSLTVISCETVVSLWKGDVVAVVGDHRLYRSQLEKYVPSAVSGEDSVRLARKYIDGWASDLLYMQIASEQLSKEEMDVTEELETYRRVLIKYRYGQKFVATHLDTVVTESQIESYYRANRKSFELKTPLLKFRFAEMMKGVPSGKKILEMLASEEDVSESLASSSVLRFIDNADVWTDAGVLAAEFGLDISSMLALKRDNYIRYEPEGRGNVMVAYVLDIADGGVAPIEYCSGRIKDVILGNRKHELLENLERDLLDDACKKGIFKTIEQ